jgi:sulfur-carrier protein adenylyltransferase/sulfurtransferase
MSELTLTEKEQYSRHIRLSDIGILGQLKIKESRILVVGAGGLGCAILQYLCAAGIGTLGIVDNDWVDLSNLPRQLLFNKDDVGKPKTLVAKEKLLSINPGVSINTYFDRLNKGNVLDIFSNYMVIVDCTDNFATRYLISDASVILNKPVVYGAANKLIGQVTVLNYQDGPTLRCICPIPPHPLEVPSCSQTGVLGSLTGIIGAIQATETLKIILGMGNVLSGKYLVFDSATYSTQLFPFSRDPEASKITELGNYEDDSCDEIIEVKKITLVDLKHMEFENPGLLLVDLRDPTEKTDIGLDCISIPYYDISQNINFLRRYKTVVFYCQYGIVSSKVINYLHNVHNMKNLYNLVL